MASSGQFESLLPLEDPKQDNNLTSLEGPKKEKFKWVLQNFSKNKHFLDISSEVFILGGYRWYIVIILKDITTEHLGLYIVSDDYKDLSSGKSWTIELSMAVINQINPKLTARKETPGFVFNTVAHGSTAAATNWFHQKKSSWGISTFIPLEELYDSSRGYLVDDKLIVEVSINGNETVHKRCYSKNETGFVGLKNQGATCYLNSLLQTLFHIPYFRKAVYQLPTTENESPSKNIPFALQSLFYKLQNSNISVSTKGLTKSFGWDSNESDIQQDVQELNRVLCEKLENKMKGNEVENTVKNLFEGHHMNYIECINIEYVSKRKESFLDLQLDIKGCKDVYASFDKYVEFEKLEGDNKYNSVEHGFQDARKSVLFINFPPVLQLHLKRFEYDVSQDLMVKIYDRYEFPLQLDLDRDNGRYLSPEADRSVHNVYTLHSVLVHKGGNSGGHYYAYIRPTLTDKWYKFNDEAVTEVATETALEEQYGGETQVFPTAYMLVYIRENDKERVMCNVHENHISEDARVRIKKKQDEKERKRKERKDTEIYTVIKVVTDKDIQNQISRDIYFPLVDNTRVRSYQVQKQNLFRRFKDEMAKEHGLAVQDLRFWLCNRLTPVYIPYTVITESAENKLVGNLHEEFGFSHADDIRLFLEVNQNKDGVILPLPERTKDEVFLFFKLYDPYQEKLEYVGRMYVERSCTLSEIIPKLNEMANFPSEQKLDLYQEIRSHHGSICFLIDSNTPVLASQIFDGDIICFQKCFSLEEVKSLPYPNVRIFIQYISSRKIVHFRCFESPMEDQFCLELSRNDTYNEVVEKLAVKLRLMDDKSEIILRGHNYYLQKPFQTPIDKFESLGEMFPGYNKTSDVLYFEVLDTNKYRLKTLEIAMHNQKTKKVSVESVSLPDNCTIHNVITVLKDKVPFSNRKVEIRILEVSYSMIVKIFPKTMKLGDIEEMNCSILRAEEIPEEEEEMGPQDMIIHVYHFSQPHHLPCYFGDPFLLVIHDTETLADVKARIKRKLEVPDNEFSKWKFYCIDIIPVHQFEDTDIISHSFRENKSSWYYFGILHSRPDDATPMIPPIKMRHGKEKGLKIYN